MTLVAGVDSSTQTCKILICDADTGATVRWGRAAHPAGTEVHPRHWWSALLAAITDAGGIADVAAISIAAQQHGMIALDLDGRVIRPALLWNDTRSAQAALALITEHGAAALAAATGSVPVASYTSTKLRWLRDEEPASAGRVAAVALPHDWLTWRLRGYGPAGDSPLGPDLSTLTTDRSDASGTGYWNPLSGQYDLEILRSALGQNALLPKVLGPLDPAGVTRFCEGGTIPDGLLVGPGAGDNAAAALGVDAQNGDAIISIGTSGTVFAVTDQVTLDATGTIAGFADATGRFLPLTATLNAARVLDATASLLSVDHPSLGDLALQAAPGSGGLVLQPYFEGERTPNLPDASATLFGMTLTSTTRANLARACIEGMLCGLATGLDALRSAGVETERTILIGGAARNAAVQTIATQVFDTSIVVPPAAEYVAHGAAQQAAASLMGRWNRTGAPDSTELRPQPALIIREQYRRIEPNT